MTSEKLKKKTIFSGVQPSGQLTLGNYLGAIRNWSNFQDEYDCFYCVVDMHAITVPQVAAELRKKSIEVLAQYIASGLDPDKNTFFIQSHVPAHAELTWVLNSLTYMGELNRMTQFKEKSRKKAENLNAALFTYPVLMAADILLYSTDLVPVGEDQRQHLELARDLAQRFNGRYSDTFVVPEGFIPKEGARIMSLQNPESKMSKSCENENESIFLIESEEQTVNKIKRAVTDSLGIVAYNDQQKGLKNLISIYAAISGDTPQDIVARYEGKGYGDFKKDTAEVVVEGLRPLREKYDYLMKNRDYLEKIYLDGAKQARRRASRMLEKVYRKIGFVRYEE